MESGYASCLTLVEQLFIALEGSTGAISSQKIESYHCKSRWNLPSLLFQRQKKILGRDENLLTYAHIICFESKREPYLFVQEFILFCLATTSFSRNHAKVTSSVCKIPFNSDKTLWKYGFIQDSCNKFFERTCGKILSRRFCFTHIPDYNPHKIR